MEASRRTVIAGGAVLTALLATRAEAQAGGTKSAGMEVIRIFTDADGVSHIQRVPVVGLPKPLPVVGVRANAIAMGVENWHHAPQKLFTINTAGDIVGEVSDGSKVPIGKGDLVYLEDLTGKGHVTHLLTDVANLFILMPPDFDFLEWAGGTPQPV
ncbi:MAG: hypothetical protein J7496_00735 [Novosphingobium sp.]|nr:hypothetical protein [Novosphingobium sp.]MBO9601010.1 hypothetical protein [Novosphingobium sp.]